jgi:hypothetical protein
MRSRSSAIAIGADSVFAGRIGSDSRDAPVVISKVTGLGDGHSKGQIDSLIATRMRLPFLNRCAVK